MSEKTREMPQLADATYAHTLVIESTGECKVHWPIWFPYGTWKVGTIWSMDLVFVNAFNDQSMSIVFFGKPLWFSPTLTLRLLSH